MAIDVLETTVDDDVHSGGGADDMIVLTTNDNVPANSTVLVQVVGWQGAGVPAFVTVRSAAAGGGTAYTKDAELRNPSGEHVISWWRLSNVGAGAPLSAYISAVTGGTAGTWRAMIVAMSGVKLSSPLIAIDTNSDAAEDPTSDSVSATGSGQIVLAGIHPVDYLSSMTAPSGYTRIAKHDGSYEPWELDYQIASGSGSFSAQWGRSSAPGATCQMVIGVYDLEGGGGGGTANPWNYYAQQ
jgi:hypothetical protein